MELLLELAISCRYKKEHLFYTVRDMAYLYVEQRPLLPPDEVAQFSRAWGPHRELSAVSISSGVPVRVCMEGVSCSRPVVGLLRGSANVRGSKI